MPRAKVTRGQRSLLLQETSQAENVHSGRGLSRLSPSPQCGLQAPPPHKLSLLEVVLAPSSGSRAQSRRSQFSGTLPSVPSIQGWAAIWSSEGLSEGRRERHHSMSCWHSARRTGVRVLPPHCPAPNLDLGYTTHTWGDPPPEKQPATQDFLILLEGNVPTHHVVEQYTQRPHSGRAPVIAVIADPLWGAVHTSA